MRDQLCLKDPLIDDNGSVGGPRDYVIGRISAAVVSKDERGHVDVVASHTTQAGANNIGNDLCVRGVGRQPLFADRPNLNLVGRQRRVVAVAAGGPDHDLAADDRHEATSLEELQGLRVAVAAESY